MTQRNGQVIVHINSERFVRLAHEAVEGPRSANGYGASAPFPFEDVEELTEIEDATIH